MVATASMNRVLVCAAWLALLVAGTIALPGPAATMHFSLLSWPTDGGRFTAKIAQGVDELAYFMRLAFTTPPTHVDTAAATEGHMKRAHAMLALRASDKMAMPSVSEAPTPLLRRTRLMAQGHEHFIQTAAVVADTELVADWDYTTRWKGVLFVGPSSGAWSHFRCWHLEQSSLDKFTLESDARVCNAWAAASDAQWSLDLYDYSVPRDAHGSNGATRTHLRRYDAMLLGHASVSARNGTVTTLHPVVFDLESRRNYLPANLFQAGTTLTVAFHGAADHNDTPIDINLARASVALEEDYTLNTDSTEIILGLPFLRSRFSAVTYDARAQRLYITWADPEPPEGLRIVVSALVILQGLLVIRWFGGDYGSILDVVVRALRSGAPGQRKWPLRVSFDVRQVFFETAGVLASGMTLALVGPYAGTDTSRFFAILGALWGLHALVSVVYMALEPRAWALMRQAVRESNVTIPIRPSHFIARYLIHVFLLGAGILTGLLLSNDSIYMMLFALMIALFLLYHVGYTVSASLACSLGLAPVSDGRTGWYCNSTGWTLYTLLQVGTLVALDVGSLLYIITPVIDAINYFAHTDVIVGFAVLLLVSIQTAAIFSVYGEVMDAIEAPVSAGDAAKNK